jgi:hypothetical protein
VIDAKLYEHFCGSIIFVLKLLTFINDKFLVKIELVNAFIIDGIILN